MKKVLILSVGVLLWAGTAFGQAGLIGLYVDADWYADCELIDSEVALVPLYAVHKYCPGATASQWMVVTGGGWNCTYVGEAVHMPTVIGNTHIGISLGYGGCLQSNILLATINYFCQGLSPSCAFIEVVGDPASGSGLVEVVDCNYTRHIGSGRLIYVNPNPSCRCFTPTKESSWGRIKSLYQ
jgi:hypothetical protein